LNPAIDYDDPLNLSQGNPDLAPESLWAGEAGYMLNYDKTTVTASVFYRYVSDGIERYSSIYNGDTTMTKPMNISSTTRTGFEFIFMQKIFDWWKMDANYTLYYTEMDATNVVGGENRNDYNWNARLNSVMSFDKTYEFQLSGRYNSKRIRPQGESKPNWSADFSFKYNINESFSVSARVRDIFNSRKWESFTDIPGVMYSTSERTRNSRSFFIGLTYKFRDYKQKKERSLDDGRMSEGEE
jgi:outer membrane cobalamin receptor